MENLLRNVPSAKQWDRIGRKPHRGINLPLSAIYSHRSAGIGEFLDLIPLLSWLPSLGMDVLQLLPLQDTGMDPSPYNALSSCALHPIYLSLHALPGLLEDPELVLLVEELQQSNKQKQVAFAYVFKQKETILRKYFTKYGSILTSQPSFSSFCLQYPFLDTYARFLARPYNQDVKEVQFHLFLQYHCFSQLSQVKKHAESCGVLLKGDLPILISGQSADLWHFPALFMQDITVGAPPDTYCTEGQNWGFPGFCYKTMAESDFSWWKDRLAFAENFYHLYRIDHAVGLMRLWHIPLGKTAKEGHFEPGDESLWEPRARELLLFFLQHSSMLPIAEDLGTIPPSLPPLLHSLGIPGTKVLRWERKWQEDGSFLDPAHFSPISLSCVSTHDSPTLAGWWRDYPQEAKMYAKQKGWEYESTLSPHLQKQILQESHRSASYFQINLFAEYLTLLPAYSHENPDEERINIPGHILPSNWTYRFLAPIETIIQDPAVKEIILSCLIRPS